MTIALITFGLVGTVLWQTAKREAVFLEKKFGGPYQTYAARVPFFFPSFRSFKTEAETLFSAKALRTNLQDAGAFLIFIPLIELLDLVHETWPIAVVRLW